MDNSKQAKWDARYQQPREQPTAAAVLRQHHQQLPASGRALDLACGLGGNALLLAAHGLSVDGWDLSPVGLAQLEQFAERRGLHIDTLARDVERQPPAAKQYDVICVSYFLHRASCAAIAEALRPGGLLFYQTFTVDNQNGPSNPDFVLQRGELLQLFPELQVLDYCEDASIAGQAWLLARRPEDDYKPL
ncbi:methyltransferase family protein [Sinobacterium caligoides]|uniref:Methyltransferase family protein n=1 Tax=Sinobacterium caligoides TaxID=933926 RepID=A0A3N2DGT0_9GAMM|nr:class I SAM-dependent methyltransferase [Sinobacterium caligoides]ROR99016.1 methyltransferase family protein [Sinobacterium caligoides]